MDHTWQDFRLALRGFRRTPGFVFRPRDDEPPGVSPADPRIARALVLSYRAWHEKFGGDSSVVGRHLVEPLLGTDYTIVGVAPPGFDYPAGADYWIPMWFGWQSTVSSFAVARLAPGASVTAARDEYLAIEQRLEPRLTLRGAHAATFAETVLGNVRPVLALLASAVGINSGCNAWATRLACSSRSASCSLSIVIRRWTKGGRAAGLVTLYCASSPAMAFFAWVCCVTSCKRVRRRSRAARHSALTIWASGIGSVRSSCANVVASTASVFPFALRIVLRYFECPSRRSTPAATSKSRSQYQFEVGSTTAQCGPGRAAKYDWIRALEVGSSAPPPTAPEGVIGRLARRPAARVFFRARCGFVRPDVRAIDAPELPVQLVGFIQQES